MAVMLVVKCLRLVLVVNLVKLKIIAYQRYNTCAITKVFCMSNSL